MFAINAPEFEQSKERPFPPEILACPGSRPDGVIWSCSAKIVIWIELSSPWDDNMTLRVRGNDHLLVVTMSMNNK